MYCCFSRFNFRNFVSKQLQLQTCSSFLLHKYIQWEICTTVFFTQIEHNKITDADLFQHIIFGVDNQKALTQKI